MSTRETYIRSGLAIINPYGGIWTDEIFQTPDEAMEYLKRFWKDRTDFSEYKLAVATLTVTLDREAGQPTFIPLPKSA